MPSPAVIERFWSHVIQDDDCWEWTGPRWRLHGSFRFMEQGRSRSLMAHRFAYELMVGPIPKGLQLDHLCRNPPCVNPAHLEPVTQKENLRRGTQANRDKTHCPQGHAYDAENTSRWFNGKYWARRCRTCMRAAGKAWYDRTKTLTGVKPGGVQRAKAHCPKGHPYNEANTYRHKGRRHCRACQQARSREWHRAHYRSSSDSSAV